LEAIDRSKVEGITKGRYKIERFKMRVGEEVWGVSINLTKKAVQLTIDSQQITLNRDQFRAIHSLGPEKARIAIKTALLLDGDILDKIEAEANQQTEKSLVLSELFKDDKDHTALNAQQIQAKEA